MSRAQAIVVTFFYIFFRCFICFSFDNCLVFLPIVGVSVQVPPYTITLSKQTNKRRKNVINRISRINCANPTHDFSVIFEQLCSSVRNLSDKTAHVTPFLPRPGTFSKLFFFSRCAYTNSVVSGTNRGRKMNERA